MAVSEYIGFRTALQGWPVNLPPNPNPGTGTPTVLTDDRVFIPNRDYTIIIPASDTSSWDADRSSYLRIFELYPDNWFRSPNTTWAGQQSYVSRRREWIFVQELLGYPYMSNGKLQRKLPVPLDFGAVPTNKSTTVPYPNQTTPTFQWNDTRQAVKFTASSTNGNNTLTGITSTASLSGGMTIQGPGVPDGTTISSKTSSTVVMSANATATATTQTFWAYSSAILRYTHWATRITKIEGIGMLGQNPDGDDPFWAFQFFVYAESGSNVLTLCQKTENSNLGLDDLERILSSLPMGETLTVAGPPFILAPVTVLSTSGIAGGTITVSADASIPGYHLIGISGGSATGFPLDEVYKRKRFHVLFERVNFEQMLASDAAFAGEWSRNTIYQDDPQSRALQVLGGVYWDPSTSNYGQPYGTINGDTTIGSAQIKNLPAQYTGGLGPGMLVTGAGIPANSTLRTVDSTTQVTISANATATATVPITFDGRVGGSGATAVFAQKEGLPKLIGENMILWKWLDVPLQGYNWSRIQSYFGSVNNATFPVSTTTSPFFNMGQETCLLRTVGRQQKNSVAGVPLWDLTFGFHYSPATDGNGYWNRLLNNKGFYQRYYSAGTSANFYNWNDFTQLFAP